MPLTPDEKEFISHLLTADEGMRLFPYLDCCGQPWRKCQCSVTKKGKLTIGIGRNLDDVGITESEAKFLLDNNIASSTIEIERSFGSWFSKLNSARKIVVVSMVFNIGITGFKTFQKMIKSIQSGDFNSAANQMMSSKWATQVGYRAVRLSEMMRSGK